MTSPTRLLGTHQPGRLRKARVPLTAGARRPRSVAA
jgi:hypothetical protein